MRSAVHLGNFGGSTDDAAADEDEVEADSSNAASKEKPDGSASGF